MSVDSEYDFEWEAGVERKVSMCGSLSELCKDEVLDRGIEKKGNCAVYSKAKN